MVFQKSVCIEPMYSELPFLERFQAAKRDGFAFVEFWSWRDKDMEAVRKAAESAGKYCGPYAQKKYPETSFIEARTIGRCWSCVIWVGR